MAGSDAPVMGDPFSQALRQPDLMERLAAMPQVRQHMADPGFIGQIEKLRAIATDPTVDVTDMMKMAEVGQKIAKAGHNDPRVMQALMGLQGMSLSVEEKDMKKAEAFGDMPRREPVQLEQLRLVMNVQDPEEAKSLGNDYFKRGDLNAALAHYEQGVELLRSREEASAAALATLLSNAALCLLKLRWPDRAKKNASMAIAAIRSAGDESFDQSKLFYRRALACEQLEELDLAVEDMLRALQQAKRANLSAAEQHKLRGEAQRLKKLKASDHEHQERIRREKENERTAEVQRMQGAKLEAASAKESKAAAVPSESYLAEQDFSHWTLRRVVEALKGLRHSCQSGGSIELLTLDEDSSKVQASVTTKKGTRALYYEMDLHCKWRGTASGGEELMGLVRVYNIAHDTKFELGGDHNTSYMYQLGWDQRVTGPWVEDMRTEAAELFDLISARVDEVIAELRKK